MGKLFDRFDVKPINGKDITIGDVFPEVLVSERDEVFCYPGICLSDEERRLRSTFASPYYMSGKHSSDASISNEISGFYRIMEGCIILDDYVDGDFHSKHLFKRLNVGVRFPCSDSYYAVFVDHEEDEELTRAIFGLTYDELTVLLEAYARVMGTYSEYFTYPKVTRSTSKENYCDVTDLWIPARFPYVAFNESGYIFSHVSLWGLYCHIQLITRCQIDSVFSRALLKNGLSEEVLNRVFDIGRMIYYQTKVTKTIRG